MARKKKAREKKQRKLERKSVKFTPEPGAASPGPEHLQD